MTEPIYDKAYFVAKGRLGGLKSARITPRKKRVAAARKAANARWKKQVISQEG